MSSIKLFFSQHITAFAIYLLLINLLTLIIFAVDKQRARRHAWRIPESTLLLLAVLGGSLGAWAAIWICHHKTRRRKFTLGVPLIFCLQLALALWIALG